MSAEYVMVQFATPRKPEVLRVATILQIEPAHAFGLCVIAWMWFDEQTEDGRAFGATAFMLDTVVGRAGFTKALAEVGWLTIEEDALLVTNFDRLMGESAKKRAKNTIRQRKHRNASVAPESRLSRDKSVTKSKSKEKYVFDQEQFDRLELLEFDIWERKTSEALAMIGRTDGHDTRFIAQVVLAAERLPDFAPVLRDALGGPKMTGNGKNNPVAYVRTTIENAIGKENLDKILKRCPPRKECPQL